MTRPAAAAALTAGVAEFAAAVLDYFQRDGRDFPWRRTLDPWRILVSELMLQQTQTQRVVPKYLAWFERFPTMAHLAEASLVDVYAAWQGLGYNSRALRLRACARQVLDEHGGQVPDDEASLLALPGIGPYTANAVLAFAFDRPTVFLETNIRSALIFHFFPAAPLVADRDLNPLAAQALTAALALGCRPQRWYQALMDYGVFIKKMEVNPSRRSQAYTRQSGFAGSLRQARGAILAGLRNQGACSLAELSVLTGLEKVADYQRLEAAVAGLVAEGLLHYRGEQLTFAD